MDPNHSDNSDNYKYPKVYSDLVALYQCYYSQYKRFPKSFRFATGERILHQIDDCIHYVIEANLVDKQDQNACNDAIVLLRKVRSNLIVIRSFLHTGWKLKIISHKSLADFQIRLDSIEKQAAKWQQWFVAKW